MEAVKPLHNAEKQFSGLLPRTFVNEDLVVQRPAGVGGKGKTQLRPISVNHYPGSKKTVIIALTSLGRLGVRESEVPVALDVVRQIAKTHGVWLSEEQLANGVVHVQLERQKVVDPNKTSYNAEFERIANFMTELHNHFKSMQDFRRQYPFV